jgi:hypothetical protein
MSIFWEGALEVVRADMIGANIKLLMRSKSYNDKRNTIFQMGDKCFINGNYLFYGKSVQQLPHKLKTLLFYKSY